MRAGALYGIVVILVWATSPASANLITNSGFETGDFTGWTVTNTTGLVSVLNNSVLTPHSGVFAAVNGNHNPLATIAQTLVTTPGQTYTFSFWLQELNNNSPPSNSFAALWNGGPLLSLVNAANFPYRQYSYTVSATSASSTISFVGFTLPLAWVLDDVSLEQTTPEPTSLVFMLGAGMLALRRRRHKALRGLQLARI